MEVWDEHESPVPVIRLADILRKIDKPGFKPTTVGCEAYSAVLTGMCGGESMLSAKAAWPHPKGT